MILTSGISQQKGWVYIVRDHTQTPLAIVYAFKDDEAITAEIQCIQKPGIALLGIAGLDNCV